MEPLDAIVSLLPGWSRFVIPLLFVPGGFAIGALTAWVAGRATIAGRSAPGVGRELFVQSHESLQRIQDLSHGDLVVGVGTAIEMTTSRTAGWERR